MRSDKPWVKLLCAKYLRGQNLLTASAKPSASPIWKGITKSIPLLRKGYYFHINSGSSVNIWHDPWIPSLHGFIPSTPLVPHTQHLVAELLIPGTRIWNRDLLLSLFDLPTVNSIQQIHLAASLAEDTIFWASNPRGEFTVKSALLIDQSARLSHSDPLFSKSWKKLWSLKINERLKFFLWKIAWDVIPSKDFLHKRIHDLDPTCPHCLCKLETSVHIFFECPFTIIVWRNLTKPLNLSAIPPISASDWVDFIIDPSPHLNLNNEDAHAFSLLAAIACDRIWWSCNKLVFEGSSSNPIDITSDINRTFISHSVAWKAKLASPSSPWVPPPPGWVKFNFDVAITPSASFLAIVGRDSSGHIISVSISRECSSSSAWAEAKAALLAVSSASSRGFSSVIFEGDAKLVIDSINCPSSTPSWSFRAFISDIRLILPSFVNVVFNFCPRSSNGLAYSIAHWASFCPTWGPQPISSILFWVFCKEADGQVPPLLPLASFGPS